MKYVVITLCVGEEFEDLSKLTHPTIKKYADSVGADFLIISSCKTTPHWEKFKIYDLLNKYDRLLYLDTDLIVREDCPNLFDIVPYIQLGAFCESRFVPREYSLIETARAYNIDLDKINWNGKYYNTGVLVVSKCHKFLFKKPELEYSNYYEQGYLNLKIAIEAGKQKEDDVPLVYDLSYKFNRMTCLDFSGETRHASYIIHYAGYHYYTTREKILSIIKNDVEKWKEDFPKFEYKRTIVLIVSGGMGDQIDAEPTLRYIKKIYKDEAKIVITTHWPRLFQHIDYKVFEHSEFEPSKYMPYYKMLTFPDPKTITYSVISNLLCHTVDYCSIAALQRTLPFEEKIIHLEITKEDDDELESVLNGFDLKKAVVIHPGRHWESKTFPIEWWEGVVNKISAKIPVCLIGTDNHENRGAYQLKIPDNSINLIDRTTVGTLISVISRAPVLLSNDSVPVHIAGAFENWIVLIPTCKHPDHVLPFRKTPDGFITTRYRSDALYKKLTLDDCDQRPSTWIEGGATAEKINGKWEDYLPEVDEVVNCVFKRYTECETLCKSLKIKFLEKLVYN